MLHLVGDTALKDIQNVIIIFLLYLWLTSLNH